MSVAERIKSKLVEAFTPELIDVRDESHLHEGHAGARPGGETHFRVTLVAKAFEGLTRVQRQRAVNDVLKAELAGPVHALALKTWTPSEAKRASEGA